MEGQGLVIVLRLLRQDDGLPYSGRQIALQSSPPAPFRRDMRQIDLFRRIRGPMIERSTMSSLRTEATPGTPSASRSASSLNA